MYYALRLSDLRLGVEKKIFFTNNAFSLYYMVTNPCLRVQEIYNFGRSIFGHNSYALSFSELNSQRREEHFL